jgi:diguanylate cyclase (GGDEF)-like protein
MSIRLRTCLSLVFGLLMILLTLLLGVSINGISGQHVKDEIGGSLGGIAYQMADKLDHFMWSRSGEVDVVSQLDVLRNPEERGSASRLLQELKANIPAFTWIGLMDRSGTVAASTENLLLGTDISKRPVFAEGSKGKFIGDVHEAVLLAKLLPNPTGEAMQFVDISVPLTDRSGQFSGVLAAHLSWEWSREMEETMMEPYAGKKQDMDIFIISGRDNTVLLGPSAMVGHPLQLASIDEAKNRNSGWAVETWADRKKYLTGYALGDGYMNYKGLDWTVLVRQPEHIAFQAVNELKRFIMIVGFAAALVFAWLGWYLAGKIAKPLTNITEAAKRVQSGERLELPYHKGITDIENLTDSLGNLIRNLTYTEAALGRMENLAHHDKLTGLPNRVGFETSIREAAEEALRNGDSLVVMYMDLDGFKKVNDTFGHLAGDELLRQTAVRIRQSLRPGETAARLGGDEFVAVLRLPKKGQVEEIQLVANRILHAIREPFELSSQKAYVGISIGAAAWPADGSDMTRVMQLADEALYVSKRKGKNCVTFHSQDAASGVS